jgi:hypothetical protein
MRVVRADAPEIVHCVDSAGALACWGWTVLAVVCLASVPGLLIALLVGLLISVRAAVWSGILIVLVWNGYMLWRSRSPRLNWVIAVCAERVYVRLFAKRGRKQASVEPEILVLESSEIASMSVHTIDLFLYGPKPNVVEWLVIEPANGVAEEVSDHIRPLQSGMSPNMCGIRRIDAVKQVYVGNEEGPLTIEWKWCRPALRTFLRQVAQQCPAIAVGPEQCSELDLNGIWHGTREGPNAQQRRMLVRAMRLGFGSNCVQLLSLYRFGTFPSYQKATAYLAEIEREEAET